MNIDIEDALNILDYTFECGNYATFRDIAQEFYLSKASIEEYLLLFRELKIIDGTALSHFTFIYPYEVCYDIISNCK